MGYRPRIARAGSVYNLPLPLKQTNEKHSRINQQVSIPLQAGVLVTDSHRGPLQIAFSGTIVVGNPDDAERSEGMVTSIITENALHEEWRIENDEPFVFYRFIDGETIGGFERGPADSGTRWYQGCFCSNLSFSFSSQTIEHLPYSFTLLVPDGVEWTEI